MSPRRHNEDAAVNVYTGQPAQNAVQPHVKVWLEVEGQWRDVTCDGLASLKIDGGRSDKTAENDATTMSITLRYDNQGFDLPHLGDWIGVAALGQLPGASSGVDAQALFYGRITDLAYEFPYLSIVAADPLADVEDVTDPTPNRDGETTIHRLEQYLIPKMQDANSAHDWLPNNYDGFTPFPSTLTKVPDWDELDVWAAIKRMLVYTGSAIFYRPDTGAVEITRGPEHWDPAGVFVPGLPKDQAAAQLPWPDDPPVLPCELIAADPPPRQYQNRAALATAWRMSYYAVEPTQDNPDPGVHYTALAPAGYRDKYGIRRGQLETDLIGFDATQLAREWVSRTGVPLWNADNVQVLLTGPLLESVGLTTFDKAWRVLSVGAGQVGRPCRVDLTGNGKETDMMIEGTSIEWRTDGWQVTLAMSHPGYYVAQFAVQAPPAQGPPQGQAGELRGNWRAVKNLNPGSVYVNDLMADSSKANVYLAFEDADHRDQAAAARAIQDGQTATLADTQGSWTITGTISQAAHDDTAQWLGFRLDTAYQNGPPNGHLISVVIT